MAKLMTAEQAVEQFGLPSPRTLRTMRQRGLPAARIGKAYLYQADDIDAFIMQAKVATCQDGTKARRSSGSTSGRAGTSSGTTLVASECALLARRTAERLKALSPSSSRSGSAGNDQAGRVILATFPSPKH